MLITEADLAAFRTEYLDSGAVLRAVDRHGHVLLRLGVGVGKSRAIDQLLRDPRVYDRFDLVVYAAATNAIVDERFAFRAGFPVSPVRLRGRPRDQCGERAGPWSELEARGCSAFGRTTLCRPCQKERGDERRCPWPDQFRRIDGVQLILCAEQHFANNRSFVVLLMGATGARRVLVILDEARLLDSRFEVSIDPDDLENFASTVGEAARKGKLDRRLAAAWQRETGALIDLRSDELRSASFRFSRYINRDAFALQKLGIERIESGFRYLGYDLALLPFSRKGERWKDAGGTIHFIARPYLACHVLLLSAHLRADYVCHRLGKSGIHSPFENHRFLHTGTRIYNLRNRIGADTYFGRNRKQIFDTFAVLIARNVSEGRTTLLVSRKKHKKACAAYLERRLREWGIVVSIVCEDWSSLPDPPRPDAIPLIHYGVLGVNDFADYESAYCVNSYYVPERELERAVQEAEPEEFRFKLKVVSGPKRLRRVVVEGPSSTDREREWLAQVYLHRMELDPAIQAIGRVRPLTKPREVVLFQMHDVESELEGCRSVETLLALREALGIPSPTEVDHALQGQEVRALQEAGLSVAHAAERLGVSRRTAFRRLRAAEGAKNPTSILNRRSGTHPASLAGQERAR